MSESSTTTWVLESPPIFAAVIDDNLSMTRIRHPSQITLLPSKLGEVCVHVSLVFSQST